MELHDRVTGILDATNRLADLVEDENLALIEHRRDDVEALLEEKATLARLYENRIKAFNESNHQWAEVSAPLRQKLTTASERLDEATRENTMRLEVAMAANKRVVAAVANALKTATPGPGTYGKSGRASLNVAGQAPVAVSLNRTL